MLILIIDDDAFIVRVQAQVRTLYLYISLCTITIKNIKIHKY